MLKDEHLNGIIHNKRTLQLGRDRGAFIASFTATNYEKRFTYAATSKYIFYVDPRCLAVILSTGYI